MSLLSQLMRPEEFVALHEPTAARLEAAVSQLVVTDQSKAPLKKKVAELVADLHKSEPNP